MKTTKRSWRTYTGVALVLLLAGGTAAAQGTQAPAPSAPAASAPASSATGAAQPAQKLYKNEQLDQMMAPVALYPDSVLSQLLMACTYPSDVAEAVKWSIAHKDAKGDAAVKQVENEEWDPSVKSLVAFPQMLTQLEKQPDWVQKTGDAFLAQPEDVMESIQRLRVQAQKAGNLKSNEQQKVVVKEVPVTAPAASEPAPTSTTNTTVIQIEPANPETVYVPSYNPTTAYGSWAYPSYPPPYWPPSPYYYPGYYPGAALASGIMFGIGVAAIGSCWGNFGWGGGNVDINVNKYNNINRNNQISNSGNRGGNSNWSHNANNRRGTPYADSGSRGKYGQGAGGANNRSQYRGNDASRQRSQQSFNNSTGFQGGDRGGGTGNRSSASGAGNRSASGMSSGAGNRSGASGAGNRSASGMSSSGGSRSSSSGSSSNAFSGASSRQSSSAQSSRGQSSQRSSSSGGSRSGGGQASRSAPSRGGGGGGSRGGGGGGRRR